MATKRRKKKKKKAGGASAFLKGIVNIFLIVCIVVAASFILWKIKPVINTGEEKPKESTDRADDDTSSKQITSGIRFDFIDADQSDCTLITTPNGKRILVDTGMIDKAPDILGFLEEAKVKSIDYLILTHPHSDHIGGAPEIMTVYDVGCIIMPDAAETGSSFDKLLAAIENERKGGCSVYEARVNDVYMVDGCKLKIHGPVSTDDEELNNSSVIMTLKYNDFTALFSGDAEAVAEEAVLKNGANIDCDLMKIGHHGSSTSSTAEFLDAATPKVGIISCGRDNAYGHPHSEVIKSLESRGIRYYVTADSGDISVISDGKDYSVYTER